MEKKPFIPTPEPQMPQYVQSISDRRARNQDGTFISHEAVQNAHETYDHEKASWDEQEADRVRVYENAAALPEDTDIYKLTASDLQEKLGISYKQALELQDAGGNGVSDLINKARDWKAKQVTETTSKEDDGLLEELPEFIQESVVRQSENQQAPGERLELTAKQMDTVLRQLISDYRKTVAGGAESEALSDYRTKILSAFNALKVKAGWTNTETEARREQLISQLDSNEAPTAAPDRVETDDDLDDLTYGRTKAEKMDEVVRRLGGGEVPQLKTDEEVNAPYVETPAQREVLTTGEREMWDELEQRRGGKLRRGIRKMLVSLGLSPDPKQGPAVAHPNRREQAETTPAPWNPPRREDVVPTAVKRKPGEVRINAERAIDEAEEKIA